MPTTGEHMPIPTSSIDTTLAVCLPRLTVDIYNKYPRLWGTTKQKVIADYIQPVAPCTGDDIAALVMYAESFDKRPLHAYTFIHRLLVEEFGFDKQVAVWSAVFYAVIVLLPEYEAAHRMLPVDVQKFFEDFLESGEYHVGKEY
jgi:hypothetical protein